MSTHTKDITCPSLVCDIISTLLEYKYHREVLKICLYKSYFSLFYNVEAREEAKRESLSV